MTDRMAFSISEDDKSQNVAYNNPDFFCYADKNVYPKNVNCVIPEHWHEDLEILYVLEGHLDGIVNGETFHLEPNEGILINCKRIHANHSRLGDTCVFYCILLHPAYLRVSTFIDRKFTSPVIGPNSFDYIIINDNDWTCSIAKDIKGLFSLDSEANVELKILETSYRMLDLLCQKYKPSLYQTNTERAYSDTFKNMVQFIREHYTEKITLDNIASSGNVGKTLCTKIFKNYTSKTPVDYLISLRIAKGIELLSKSSLSITDIAYATGFNSASHFTKTFREQVGCTPHDFKKTTPITDYMLSYM